MNLEALKTAALECITVSNEWLPEEFHDDIRGGRTLARLEEMCEVRDGITEHVKRQQTKARNIEKLCKQVEAKSVFAETKAGKQFVDLDSELDYSNNEIDDLQLTKNMMALVAGMVNGGVLDADDLEE